MSTTLGRREEEKTLTTMMVVGSKKFSMRADHLWVDPDMGINAQSNLS